MKIDFNCDMGESFGSWNMGNDTQIVPYITSINAACGFHASDPMVMNRTVRLAWEAGVQIGAHPGFHDLTGFGRRQISTTPEEAYTDTLYQIGALHAFVKAHGMTLQHVKPHGAIYNMAAKDKALAQAICQAVRDFDPSLIVLALPAGELYKTAQEMGLRAAAEVFADRAYNEDGTLVSRSMAGSMITDTETAVSRVVRMVKEGKVTAITGKDIDIRADSVCIHGDGAHAVEFAKMIRERLLKEQIEIVPLNEIV